MKKLAAFLLICIVAFDINAQINQAELDEKVLELFDLSIEDFLNQDILSATQKKQSVLDAPAQAYIITRAQIEDRGYMNLVDLLDDVPQFSFLLNSDPENRNLVSVRGVTGNEKLLILKDGIRMTPATGDFYAFSQQFGIWNAERVEIIIGPASALYGVDAFSGVINIITKKVSDSYGRVTSQVGNYQTQQYAFDVGMKANDFSLSIAGQFYNSDEPDYHTLYPNLFSWYNNYFRPNGWVQITPREQEIHFLEQFEYEAGPTFNGRSISRGFDQSSRAHNLDIKLNLKNLTLGFSQLSERHSTSYGIDPRFTAYDRDAWSASTQNIIYGVHEYQSFDKSLTLRSILTLNFYEIDPESNFVNLNSLYQRGYIYSYSNTARLEQQFNWDISKKVNLAFGYSHEEHAALPRSALSPIPYNRNLTLDEQELYYIGAGGYEPFVYENLASNGGMAYDIDRVVEVPISFSDSSLIEQKFYFTRFQNTGGYFQGIFKPSYNVDFVAGARYDYNSRYGAAFNPRLGLVSRLTSKTTIKMTYGTSFLSPSPSKSFKQSGSFEGIFLTSLDDEEEIPILFANTFHQINPDLKPEKLSAFELGFNTFIAKKFSFQMSFSTSTILNTINLYADRGEFQGIDGEFITEALTGSVNESEKVKINSLSFGLNYFEDFRNLKINAYLYYDYVNGKTEVSETPIAYHPETSLKGGATLTYKPLSFSFRFVNRGEMRSNPSQRFPTVSPAFFNAKATGSYRFYQRDWGNLTFTALVNNLFDSRYYNVSQLLTEAILYTPQDPLRWSMGLKMTLE